MQNPISFAYTASDRDPVSTLLVQPIVLVYLGRGFYVKSADATLVRSAGTMARRPSCRSASGSDA